MKPNAWVSSAQADEFLLRQQALWPLAKENYHKLDEIQVRTFDMGGFHVVVQFTPSRILSSTAKVDLLSLKNRKCFLCAKNLPQEQEWLSFGLRYYVLCNPYPIFREHFTIVDRLHKPQEIKNRFDDFLELIKRLNAHTLFYNGPCSGASAPDHAHFQAVTRGVMPMDKEVEGFMEKKESVVLKLPDGVLYALTHYLRNGFILRSTNRKTMVKLFNLLYDTLEIPEGEVEPKMNLFGFYKENEWIVTLIPRKAHRPRQFYAEGDEQVLVSPGGADMGGLFITAREEDFKKMTPALLCDIYEQVSYSDAEIGKIVANILLKHDESYK